MKAKGRPMVYFSYCQNSEHGFSQCPKIPTLTKDQLSEWIRTNRRCWRCGLAHQAVHCGLKKPCPLSLCLRKHLWILHELNERLVTEAAETEACLVSSVTQTLSLIEPVSSNKVLLNVVLLHHDRSIWTRWESRSYELCIFVGDVMVCKWQCNALWPCRPDLVECSWWL